MNVRSAEAKDVNGVAETLVDAFFDDPVWSWAFADAIHRRDQYEAWFKLLIGGALEHQWVRMTPSFEAVSVWVPPGCKELSEADEVRLQEVILELLGDRSQLVMEVFDCFDSFHPHDREHFYLSLLGTRSDHRGFGIGMGLLATDLERVDALHMPVYLESTNPANIKRYESVGFEVYESYGLPSGGPPVTSMWRNPR